MKWTWNNCLNLGLPLSVGIFVPREVLLRLIQGEECNASVYKTLSEVFQDIDGSLTTIFSKMASKERRHVVVLTWCYRKRFGSEPAVAHPEKFDPKTLERALDVGLCRLLKEKLAEKRRGVRLTLKWPIAWVVGLVRRSRGRL